MNASGLWRRNASKGVIVLFVLLALCSGARGGTYTVVDGGDDPDAKTLRAAIIEANENPGADTIVFDLGTATISPLTELPALSDATGGTTIDGGGTITISGSGTTTDISGLTLSSNGNVVMNLCIVAFDMAGVAVLGDENQVKSCLLGLTPFAADANSFGVGVMGNDNIIGGESREDGNVISGNIEAGVILGGGASGNYVRNNFIGTDMDGVAAVPNDNGVVIDSGSNNYIGGLYKGQGNLISGNLRSGVVVNDDTSEYNYVQGNRIGLKKSGEALGNGGDGIFVGAALSTLIGGDFTYGNRISANDGNGISVQKIASNTFIQGNVVGMDGSEDKSKIYELANLMNGIQLEGTEDILIGGPGGELGEGNIISANVLNGIYISSESANTEIYANKIGVMADGAISLGNGGSGIYIDNSAGTIIGIMSGLMNRRNIISGNSENGVAIVGTAATGNQVNGCHIGTDAAGTSAIPNGLHGVYMEGAPANTIGGAYDTGYGNLISGNEGHGVMISMPGGTGNVVLGNRIGVNVSGSAALPNEQSGVVINEAPGNTVGGSWYADRNIISGNTNFGVMLMGTNSRNTAVENNLIGTNQTQDAAIPNDTGVMILGGAHDNTIGGVEKYEGNVISGNTVSGVTIQNSTSIANYIEGNFIGVDSDGEFPLSPGAYGVRVLDQANGNVIGGVVKAANIIAHATVAGIQIDGGAERVSIRRNSIFNNSDKGIAIAVGCNQGIQPPVIEALGSVSGTGPVNSAIDIFVDDEDEGRIYLASAFSSATGEFSSSVDLSGYSGMYVTATATDLVGNTSEFSEAVLITAEGEEEGSVEGEGTAEGSVEGEGEGGGEGEGEGEEPEGEPGVCPGESIFAQPPSPPAGSWSAWHNDNHMIQRIYENVTGVSGSIQSVSWWGFGAHYVKGKGLEPCYRDVDSFDVQVYADDGGQPGSYMYGITITPEKAFTGWHYDMSFGSWPLYHYTATLSTPLVLAGEAVWISLLGVGDVDCFFFWLSSYTGDGSALMWDGSSYEPTILDASLCLNTGSEGELEGVIEGTLEGSEEGTVEGELEGTLEGVVEGSIEGAVEGVLEGSLEGAVEGSVEGAQEGLIEGEPEGTPEEGQAEGLFEGVLEGAIEGVSEGAVEGEPSEGEGGEEGEGALEGEDGFLTADQDHDNAISLSELLRVIQFFNSNGFHCQAGTEDGYAPGPGDTSCAPYDSDYNPTDWEISLSELLRVIQFFNSGGYHYCPGEGTEDGFCPGP
ncbi:MAG TPA: hypothetical protein PLI09_28885 [Candidatus Hydrogenedentes bacterium]|nr:hypothetical protein [Candidatus Hydrogenedentota bacterium]